MAVVITLNDGSGEKIVATSETHDDAWREVISVWRAGHAPTDWTGYAPGRTISVRPARSADNLSGVKDVTRKKITWN